MASDKPKPKSKSRLKKELSSDFATGAWDSPQGKRRSDKLKAESIASAAASTPPPETASPSADSRASQAPGEPETGSQDAPPSRARTTARSSSLGGTPVADGVCAKRDQPATPTPTAASSGRNMSSQRNRQRGPNRNSDVGSHGEELALWQSCQAKLQGIVDSFNESSENVINIRDHEKRMAEKRDTGGKMDEMFSTLDGLLRSGVKVNDTTGQAIANVIEELKIVQAVMKAKEESQEQSTSRSATQRAKESTASSSIYDFDGVGDSPGPSPNPTVSRRMGGSSGSKGDRDSVPPKTDRSTPVAKAGSAEPQGPAIARSKVVFAKGDEVAFKPKPANNEQTDWILGIVQEVRGEGKARRYKVLDADVDENGKQKDFRSSASSMIPIPKDGTNLPPLEAGRVVLALYPNTTTFYKAEVMGMGEGKVNLKFEGEESSNTMQSVGRRHVVEYRG